MPRPFALPLVLLACLATLAGCADRDPYRRTDVWRPTGANAANLAAMVADPHDLIRGRGTTRSDARASAAAIDRVWTDQPRSLSPGAAGGAAGGAAPQGSGGAASGAAAGGG